MDYSEKYLQLQIEFGLYLYSIILLSMDQMTHSILVYTACYCKYFTTVLNVFTTFKVYFHEQKCATSIEVLMPISSLVV